MTEPFLDDLDAALDLQQRRLPALPLAELDEQVGHLGWQADRAGPLPADHPGPWRATRTLGGGNVLLVVVPVMPLAANRYEILRPLGSGGMADAMAAHDTRLGRDVAIKLIRSAQLAEPVNRERLLREARAAAALHHPNTVAVYAVGADDDPFIVMELVEGETLKARLRQRAPLSVAESVRIGSALLGALEAAHVPLSTAGARQARRLRDREGH